MAEYSIHNIRFYKNEPKAINCMTYNIKHHLLALSRSDNAIEIWNCKYKLFKQHSIIGSTKGSIESLAWCNKWLFCAGQHNFIYEYEICDYKKQTPVTGGFTWCLATSPNSSMLAAGTEQGIVCLFNVTDDGLIYLKHLDRQEGPILSLAWHSGNGMIATGSINFIHIKDIDKGKVSQIPVKHMKKNASISIWCIALLSDMTVVSGDSSGKICFWNGIHCSEIASCQTHQADILSLCVSSNEKSIYAAGIDPVIVEVQLVDLAANKKPIWVKSVHRRIHTHDVRALALNQEGKLFSGGVDTYLAISHYPPKYAVKYPATPHTGLISLSKAKSQLLLGNEDRMELWQLGTPDWDSGTHHRFFPIKEDRVKLALIETSKEELVQCCHLSPEGTAIAYATESKLRLFRYSPPTESKKTSLKKIKCPKEDLLPLKQLMWLNENEILISTSSAQLKVVTINEENVATTSDTLDLPDGETAIQFTTSEDGSFLVAVSSSNAIVVFDLRSDVELFRLPKLSAPVTAMAINESNELFVALSDSTLFEYDLQTRTYTSFGRQLINSPYNELKKSIHVILNISFLGKEKVFLHTVSQLILVDKNSKDVEFNSPTTKSARLVLDGDSNSSNSLKGNSHGAFTSIDRSNHVCYFSTLKNKDLVSVEINPIWIMDNLPPALKTKKFGAM